MTPPASQPDVKKAGAIEQNLILMNEVGATPRIYNLFPIVLLLCTDLFVIALSVAACGLIKLYFIPAFDIDSLIGFWPGLIVLAAAYSAASLYPAIAINPVDELRRLTWCTTLVFMAFIAAHFLPARGGLHSIDVLLGAWLLSLAWVPCGRGLVRACVSRRSWWGKSVFVLGAGAAGERVITELLRRPGLGLKPLAVFDDDLSEKGELRGIPVLGDVQLAPKLAAKFNVSYCIVALPDATSARQLQILELCHDSFAHCLVLPAAFGFSSIGVPSKDLGGVLSYDVAQLLLNPWLQFAKRLMDIVLTAVGGIVVLPFVLLCAILIKLDSSGPAFFGHTRIGRNGRRFKAWKFRSMHKDAAARFKECWEYGSAPASELDSHWNDKNFWEDCLQSSVTLRKEWVESQKLKADPRVTRIGALLRKTSMDELPQLWNVLVGEMSLVGPRPIVEDEIQKYGDYYQLYLKATPGMTGLWQVSGRSNTSYDFRVQLDVSYVRNWSLWLDVYILARTVRVVLLGSGAY